MPDRVIYKCRRRQRVNIFFGVPWVPDNVHPHGLPRTRTDNEDDE